jgi:hypothetical protein
VCSASPLGVPYFSASHTTVAVFVPVVFGVPVNVHVKPTVAVAPAGIVTTPPSATAQVTPASMPTSGRSETVASTAMNSLGLVTSISPLIDHEPATPAPSVTTTSKSAQVVPSSSVRTPTGDLSMSHS